jgi:hypothetical protein
MAKIEMYEGRPVFRASNSEQLANAVAQYKGDIEPPYVVRIPVRTKYVKYRAFIFNDDIGVVILPDSVYSIDEEAFTSCDNLTSVILPESLELIDYSAFSGCSSLSDISIPSSVRTIRDGAFCCCESLTKITIPAAVCEIGKEAFSGCENLTEVTFLGEVQEIGENCFMECSDLTKIIVPDKKGKAYKKMLPDELHALIVEQSESATFDTKPVKKAFTLKYTQTIRSSYVVTAETKKEAEALFRNGKAELIYTDKEENLDIDLCYAIKH